MNKELKTIYILLGLTGTILVLSLIGGVLSRNQAHAIAETEHLDNISIEDEDIIDNDQDVQEDIIPDSLNALVIGFDESGGLTDVMMVGSLNTETNELKVISVPRDLYIDFKKDKYKEVKANNPNSQVIACKLNEVYSYSGWDDRALLDVKELVSIITGLKIDYMVTIDIDGFEQVVDAIGGVDFYVPQRMYYYDPAADFLIDLEEGQQVLDGKHALQLVRYRKYPAADLRRIEVQQDFLVEVYHEIISDLNLQELLSLTKIAYDIVDTDFGLFDILDYAEYLFSILMK
jgi:LCP family protein required for cell wall assembly